MHIQDKSFQMKSHLLDFFQLNTDFFPRKNGNIKPFFKQNGHWQRKNIENLTENFLKFSMIFFFLEKKITKICDIDHTNELCIFF